MKRFNSVMELLQEINKEGVKDYWNNEISDYLACEGSDVVDDENDTPKCTINIDGYKVGVTSLEVEEEKWVDYYWLEV